jgi:magnesium chelatase accessory protein
MAHYAWARDGADWPNRCASSFVACGGVRWHVQLMGQGPVVVLAHGTGAATHSWRDVMPLLARDFTVVAPDLPGHGFSEVPSWHPLSLPGMARDLAALLGALKLAPVLAVGHSAGAAILARMCLDGLIAPAGLVSLNGAFVPLGGAAGQFFAPLARLLVGLPMLPELFSWRAADPKVVARLLAGTGSSLDEAGIRFYARLVRNPAHAAAALRMMASWDLPPLLRDLRRLRQKLLLVVGENDKAIPPADAEQVRRLVPGAEIVTMPGLGHLSHEEDAMGSVAIIRDFARGLGVA